MKKYLLLTLLAIFLIPFHAALAGMREANEAYSKGEFSVALNEYKKLASDGEEAQYILGVMYAYGQGVPQDYQTAVSWFRKAAEQDNSAAQYRLGMMYANGQGVPQNYKKASLWFYRSGVLGNAPARYRLGVIYLSGLGLNQNDREAALWFRMAAEQGQANAQNNLGVMFSRGQGVALDWIEAYKWLTLASASGNSDAEKNKSLAENNMSREQIALAQSLAQDWLAHRGVVTPSVQGHEVKDEIQ